MTNSEKCDIMERDEYYAGYLDCVRSGFSLRILGRKGKETQIINGSRSNSRLPFVFLIDLRVMLWSL